MNIPRHLYCPVEFLFKFFAKGQLFSKCIFCVFNSSKKMDKKIQCNVIKHNDTSGRIVFINFFWRIENNKKTFRNQFTFRRLVSKKILSENY